MHTVSFDQDSLTMTLTNGYSFQIRTEGNVCAFQCITWQTAIAYVYDATGLCIGSHRSKRADCRKEALHDLVYPVSGYLDQYTNTNADRAAAYDMLAKVLAASARA